VLLFLVAVASWLHLSVYQINQEATHLVRDLTHLDQVLAACRAMVVRGQADLHHAQQSLVTVTAAIHVAPVSPTPAPVQHVTRAPSTTVQPVTAPLDGELQRVSWQPAQALAAQVMPAQVMPAQVMPAQAWSAQAWSTAATTNTPWTITPTTEDYWKQIQVIAQQNIIGQNDQTKFLQRGSDLIQKLEEAQAKLQVDLESLQFLEVKANDEGVDGILKMNEAKKKMTEQITLIAQYQRDLATLIQPYKSVNVPKMSGTLTPNIGTQATRFSHLSMESEIVMTQNRSFLVTLHFFFTDNHADPPQLMSVTDIFNLSTMQSTSKQFFYPEYFLKDIYELVRKTWRGQGVKWNRKPTTEDLQVFLTVINHE